MSGLMEFFPLLCGLGLGLLLGQFRTAQMRQLVWLVLSCLGGLVANQLSGEGPAWLLFDLLCVALTAQLVRSLGVRLIRHLATSH